MLTVLMSVCNGADYVCDAVDSILGQTLSDFEFVIINDASSDGTRELLEHYTDSRIRLFHFPVNRGLVAALNFGIRQASGRWIARMDSDDVAHPDRLRSQVEYFSNNSDLCLLGTSFNVIDAQGRFLRNVEVLQGSCNIFEALLNGNQLCHPSVMFDKHQVLSIGGYRSIAGRYAQDYDLWLRLSEVGLVDNINSPLLNYRVHDKQVSYEKIPLQKKSAEIYRMLAKQRRSGSQEDLDRALLEFEVNSGAFNKGLAKDYIDWGEHFVSMGEIASARQAFRRAIGVRPFGRVAWRQLIGSYFF